MNNIVFDKGWIRDESIEYWKYRNPKICFNVFLLCLKKREDIPWLPKDIRKLLFDYFNKFVQFHHNKLGKWDLSCLNYGNQKYENKIQKLTQLDFVEPINYIIHANSIYCTHISYSRFGRDKSHTKFAFKIVSDKVIKDLTEIENRNKMSLEKIFNKNLSNEEWRFSVLENTLFYAIYSDVLYPNVDIDKKSYTNFDSILFDKNGNLKCLNFSDEYVYLINNKELVKFDLVFSAESVSKTGKEKNKKRWAINFKLIPKL